MNKYEWGPDTCPNKRLSTRHAMRAVQAYRQQHPSKPPMKAESLLMLPGAGAWCLEDARGAGLLGQQTRVLAFEHESGLVEGIRLDMEGMGCLPPRCELFHGSVESFRPLSGGFDLAYLDLVGYPTADMALWITAVLRPCMSRHGVVMVTTPADGSYRSNDLAGAWFASMRADSLRTMMLDGDAFGAVGAFHEGVDASELPDAALLSAAMVSAAMGSSSVRCHAPYCDGGRPMLISVVFMDEVLSGVPLLSLSPFVLSNRDGNGQVPLRNSLHDLNRGLSMAEPWKETDPLERDGWKLVRDLRAYSDMLSVRQGAAVSASLRESLVASMVALGGDLGIGCIA